MPRNTSYFHYLGPLDPWCLACLDVARVWRAGDPRKHLLDHSVSIVVSDGRHASLAHVEARHGWHVEIHDVVAGVKWVGENDKWPADLYWVRLPSVISLEQAKAATQVFEKG